MEFNKFIDRNRLRRESLKNKQNKFQNRGKKSLSKRIIAERVDGITSQNIEAEFDRLAEAVLIDETTATILYHLKFARDARPATFNDDVDELWEYRSRFLILLVAFGAKSKYCIPRIVGEFDKTNMKQYEFFMIPEGNRKYSGVITDGQGNDVAYV